MFTQIKTNFSSVFRKTSSLVLVYRNQKVLVFCLQKRKKVRYLVLVNYENSKFSDGKII